jgi:hypothetical protein
MIHKIISATIASAFTAITFAVVVVNASHSEQLTAPRLPNRIQVAGPAMPAPVIPTTPKPKPSMVEVAGPAMPAPVIPTTPTPKPKPSMVEAGTYVV